MQWIKFKTKKLEKNKIVKTVSKFYSGFTCYEVLGYWNGKSEKALKIEIATAPTKVNEDAINTLAGILKDVCKQDSIMVKKVNSVITFN